MKDSFLQLAFWLIVLVVGAGIEESLPRLMGLGFPVLLAAVQAMSCGRATVATTVVFSIAAGAVEDALCALPPMTSASYFLAVAMTLKWSGLFWGALAFAYPCYQLWLEIWTGGLGGEVFNRLIVSVPVGFITSVAVFASVTCLGRKAPREETC